MYKCSDLIVFRGILIPAHYHLSHVVKFLRDCGNSSFPRRSQSEPSLQAGEPPRLLLKTLEENSSRAVYFFFFFFLVAVFIPPRELSNLSLEPNSTGKNKILGLRMKSKWVFTIGRYGCPRAACGGRRLERRARGRSAGRLLRELRGSPAAALTLRRFPHCSC